jgi:hypothetical protein
MSLNSFQESDYWKAIILYGLNQATYKIALGKVLLSFAEKQQERIIWEDLSKAFLDIYIERLKEEAKPQQSIPTRRTVMENIVNQIGVGSLNYENAIEQVGRNAFNDVIERFHTIGNDKNLCKDRFYTFNFGKELILKPDLMQIVSIEKQNLHSELDARWSLLEGAFTINISDYKLANNIRSMYLQNGYNRKPLGQNVPFLRAYQGDVCFYCGQPMHANDIEVDHVLPRQVLQHDEIWNLVLAHETCNGLKLDKVIGPHFIEKLFLRNENIMGSNHPWKAKISANESEAGLGATVSSRKSTLNKHYENVKKVLGNSFWLGDAAYDPSKDVFFVKLITQLNKRA